MNNEILEKDDMNLYVTSDLYLSAYLLVKGHNFNIDKKGKKSLFSFIKSQDLDLNVNEYLMGRGKCEPLAFTNAIKNIKNLLFNS
jgi:hypothetical protein